MGPFCLFETSLPEIDFRAQLSWQAVVAQQVSHRPGLQNLHLADVHGTRRWIAQMPTEHAGMCRKLLNGAHFTREAQQYWQQTGEDLCQFCECSDSRYHRFWQCEAFCHLRQHMDPHVWAMVPFLPEFLTCYGWGLRPATWKKYLHTSLQIVESPFDLTLMHCPADGCLELFTDGSCHFPTHVGRLAGWAAVQADPSYMDVSPQSRVLAASPLQGLLQTAYRAELRAVLEAVCIARHCGMKVRIWCDCQGVVDRVRAILLKQWRARPNGRHYDSWLALCNLLDEIGAERVVITKVAAHQDPHVSGSALDAWCFCMMGL